MASKQKRRDDGGGGLNARQRRFVDEYMIDLNGRQAAIRAGYSDKTAQEQSSQLLSLLKVQAAIGEAKKALAARLEKTVDEISGEIDLLASSNVADIFDVSGDKLVLKPANQIPAKAWRCISSVKVKRQLEKHGDGFESVELIEFKLWDKVASLRLAGLRRGMFVEKRELTGAAGEPIKLVVIETNHGDKPCQDSTPSTATN